MSEVHAPPTGARSPTGNPGSTTESVAVLGTVVVYRQRQTFPIPTHQSQTKD